MRTVFTTCLVLIGLLLTSPVLASDALCDHYGVRCYKTGALKPDRGVIEGLYRPDGAYVGSLHIPGGNCGFLGCGPCDETMADVDPDRACNDYYVECEGNCFAE